MTQEGRTTKQLADDIRHGGAARYHEKNREAGKLFARERLALLFGEDGYAEDGLFANALAGDLPADGVITGVGRIYGQPVCFAANDSTVKAGSWGARTVEKIIRIQETAMKLRAPLVYLVDSAGARITDQVEMFPSRRGAGRIFYNQVRMSGMAPQVCALFGPSAAGGAYIPAFCDVVMMVDGNASMYLGSPRMAEMVIGEKVTLEEMGGARMHCSVSGCGDILCADERAAIAAVQRYLGYFLGQASAGMDAVTVRGGGRAGGGEPTAGDATAGEPATGGGSRTGERSAPGLISDVIPENQNAPFDMYRIIERLTDADSFFEIKQLFAREIITGFARLDGRAIGVVANQPQVKGGVLFVDSADKAARFITLCDAYDIPLLFLADVPGFMIGTKVEQAGIIRHGAKMIAAVVEATTPKISVVLRKAYGAGLYAMAGPAFEPDACLALPGAQIAVMGPEAAVNAVYSNRIAELDASERAAFVSAKRDEYRADIDIVKLAAELVVDAIVEPDDLRAELVRRFALYANKRLPDGPERKHAVHPV